MSLDEFAAGEAVAADDLNRTGGYGVCVARARRETNSSSTSAATELPVLRLDDIPVEQGHLYDIVTNPLLLDTTVANDVMRVLLRIDETGADATIASTNISLNQRQIPNASQSETCMLGTTRAASAAGLWSVLLSVVRQSGTGTGQIFGATTHPIEIKIIDLGMDPGDTGVDL